MSKSGRVGRHVGSPGDVRARVSADAADGRRTDQQDPTQDRRYVPPQMSSRDWWSRTHDMLERTGSPNKKYERMNAVIASLDI
jgi:hypothetical protein